MSESEIKDLVSAEEVTVGLHDPAPQQPAPQDAPSIWTSGGMWNEGMLKDLETPAYIRNKGRR